LARIRSFNNTQASDAGLTPSCSGYDWTRRYPWIVEAALKNRTKQFVIDGEAVILGVDGYSDFNALHSGKHNDDVQPISSPRLSSLP